MGNTPNIRFKGFTDDWEQRKVWELVKEGVLDTPLDGNHGEKHPTSNEYVDEGIPFLMASDIHDGEADIKSCKFITKERAEQLDKGFARNGDVLLTHKASIGETAILNGLTTEYAMLTPQVTYYRIQNEERLNRKYLYAFFNSLDFQKDLKTKAAQSTRPYIGITAQQNLNIVLPKDVREQKRIGTYFYNLDNLITLHQRKRDETKELKKFLLQKMFPKNGEKKPEIRFEGFTDDWEQRKLSELIIEYKETVGSDCTLPILTSSKTEGVILQEEHFGRKQNHDITGYNILPRNYCTYRNRSDGVDFTFNINRCCDKGIISKFYPVFCGNNSDIFFISLVLNNSDEVIREIGYTCTGTGQKVLSFLDLQKMKIRVPKYEEQKRIASYIENLDHLITLHQGKCEKLKEIKKFMLQNMFPQKG